MNALGLNCPIARALGVIGERWTPLIVRDLLNRGSARFRWLQQSLEGISPNTLSARLKQLEDAGVVEKRMYQSNPPRAEYVLTDRGKELGDLIYALAKWGMVHTKAPPKPK